MCAELGELTLHVLEPYSQHILLHYNQTVAELAPAPTEPLPDVPDHLAQPASHLRRRKLADMTYFFQAYLAWHDVVRPRLREVTPETGFVNFGPNVKLECGTDSAVGLHFPVRAPPQSSPYAGPVSNVPFLACHR